MKKARFINEKIEEELIEFKQEISDKFEKSEMNLTFKFPRVKKPHVRTKTASALSAMDNDDDECVIEIGAVVATEFGK